MVHRPNVDNTLCFVLMPFKDPFNSYYEDVIKKVVREGGLSPRRADEIYGIKPIIKDIWESIWCARLVIADVTGRNPNVNYELGLCHALGVPTILMTKTMDDVPFDYSHHRCIVYNTEKANWVQQLQVDLERTIRAALETPLGDCAELRWPYESRPSTKQPGGLIIIENPREIVLRGMTQAVDLVARAFGPCGSHVSISPAGGGDFLAHKRGLTILSNTHSANRVEESGIDVLRRVAQFMADRNGDGAKTAAIVAHSIVAEGVAAITRGCLTKDLLEGIKTAALVAKSEIAVAARPCGPEDLIRIAVTACGDSEIAEQVVAAVTQAGKDGVVVVQARLGSLEVLVQEGFRFERGFLSAEFVTDQGLGECQLEDCRILVCDFGISSLQALIPLLEAVARAECSILVIADNVEGEALATLVVNRIKGTISCAAVRAPGGTNYRAEHLRDIAVLTGATLISQGSGTRLDRITLADLGRAEKVVVARDTTTILGGYGDPALVQNHIQTLRVAIENTSDAAVRERLQVRLANVAGKIATISVGGATEVDLDERHYAATTALHSVQAALEEGVCAGGGLEFVRVRKALRSLALSEKAKPGAYAVMRSLNAPFRALATSCCHNPANIFSKFAINDIGDSLTDQGDNYAEQAILSGILDPAKTLRLALDAATSYACLALKADVANLNQE